MQTALLGQVAAEQMKAIEDDYGEDGEIQVVCSIVGVAGPDGQEVRMRANCTPQTVLALLHQAQEFALSQLVDGEAEA
jgi:hypothetical protein